MKSRFPFLAGAMAGFVSLLASGAALAPSAPLMQDGPIVVDAADFEGNMLRIPADKRGDFRMSYDRVATVLDNIFVARSLAVRAREAGLDKDPAVQRRMQQLQEALLADLYINKVEKDEPPVNLEQRAREVFKADYSTMMRPEEVYIQHILIGLKGRTPEMALELARKVRAEAAAPGADFLAVAAKYNEDPDARRNGGDLGYSSAKGFVDPVRVAIEKMDRKGEISEPVQSEFGYHIIKFIDRRKAQPVKFEEVKRRLIDAEREKLAKKRVEAVIQEVRSPTVTIYKDNIEKLVVPVDTKEIERKAAEAAAAPKTK